MSVKNKGVLMLILLSPTKTMKTDGKYSPTSIPVFSNESSLILNELRKLSLEEIMKLMKVKEKIAKDCVEQYRRMKLNGEGTCAIETYDGLQYKYMKVNALFEQGIDYVQEHVRILSGFYGLLMPFDSIYPYRLEMQAKLSVKESNNLYLYWKDTIAKACLQQLENDEEPYIINLASKEYEKVIRPYIPKENFIDIIFKIEKNKILKTESTQVKMARGRMVRYMAKHNIKKVSDICSFDDDGYQYSEEYSNLYQFVFIKRL